MKKRSSAKNKQIKVAAYWLVTLLGPTVFAIIGLLQMVHAELPMMQLRHLGFPAYFATILGVWKVWGAIIILIPRFPLLKEWAYAGFCFDLTGAAASHAFVGDPFFSFGHEQIATPLICLILVFASWALRPANRRLQATYL